MVNSRCSRPLFASIPLSFKVLQASLHDVGDFLHVVWWVMTQLRGVVHVSAS